MIPKVKEGFTNQNGIYYDKVREIAYNRGELAGNLGKFITESHLDSDIEYDDKVEKDNGVYVYQSYSNPNVAYRIYKSFAEYGFNGNRDDKLIQQLRERESEIKLSKFPTGVVTLEGRIIGQEIPYYPNKITLHQLFEKYKDINPSQIYKIILDILKELYDNEIVYTDNHSKNFMINPENISDINIIDFDAVYIKFDPQSDVYKNLLFRNYFNTINFLNKMLEISHITGELSITDNFDDAYEQINQMTKKLTKI